MLQNCEYVLVSISCRNLKNQDFLLDKSDPYVKVSMSHAEKGTFGVVDTTQTKFNELNPNFDKTIRLPYFFEKRQFVRFDIYDRDSKDSSNDDFLGCAQTELSRMMGADKQTQIMDVVLEGKPAGKLITRCDVADEGAFMVTLSMRGLKLANTDSLFDFWDKSDPYLKFLKKRGDGTKVAVHTTEFINNSLNPSWRPVTLNLGQLCGNDKEKTFVIECWDHEDDAADQYIGEVETSVAKLTDMATKKEPLALVSKKYSNPGLIACDNVVLTQFYKFVDYLRGGLKLTLCPCIDFTGSNGDPKRSDSLHYISPATPNKYQLALHSVSEILLNYSPNSLIPAFGFGAKIPGMVDTSHCFPLSLNPGMQSANGLADLMAQYSNSLMKVNLSGPTLFTPIVNKAAELANQLRSASQFVYLVQLILTDGAINDMSETIEAICRAALLPLSIIIVGIGNANFDAMEKLDGDSGLYNSKGQLCPRDIVQFVPFNSVANDKDRLRQQVLAELPKQVEQYYRVRGIQPLPPMSSDPNELIKTPGFRMDELVGPLISPGYMMQMAPMAPPPPGFGVEQFITPLMDPAYMMQMGYMPPGYAPQPGPGHLPPMPPGMSGPPAPGMLIPQPQHSKAPTKEFDYPSSSGILNQAPLLSQVGPSKTISHVKGDIQ